MLDLIDSGIVGFGGANDGDGSTDINVGGI